jgi:hypothetical protein
MKRTPPTPAMLAALTRALWLEAHGFQGEPWIVAPWPVKAALVHRGLALPYQVLPGTGPVHYRPTAAGRALVERREVAA